MIFRNRNLITRYPKAAMLRIPKLLRKERYCASELSYEEEGGLSSHKRLTRYLQRIDHGAILPIALVNISESYGVRLETAVRPKVSLRSSAFTHAD